MFETIESYLSNKENNKKKKTSKINSMNLVKEANELIELKREINEALATLINNEDDRILLHSIGQSSPVMQWAKDKEGVYTYANVALAKHLFGSENPEDIIGKDDKEIGAIVTKKYPKWTFGSICMGTDDITLKEDKPMKFFEWGIIKDEFQYVTAYKNTYKDRNGNILGTCGLAIYATKEVNSLLDILNSTTCDITKVKLKKYLQRYGFDCNNTFTNINIENLWKKRD